MSRNPMLAVLVLALVGCGAGQAHATVSPPADPAQVAHQLGQCVRAHGDPTFPDPTIDAQGHPQSPPGVPKPSDQAISACSSILDQLPNARTTLDQPDLATLRQFAQCLRDHGIQDWPDPDDQGQFHLPPDLAGGNLKTSPRWPQIQAAWRGPCKRYDTAGHISVAN